MRKAAVGQVVQHEAPQVDAADAVDEGHGVDPAPQHGLRAGCQARVATAVAQVRVIELGVRLARP